MTEAATGEGTQPKKWAGKFDTPEALEEAYNTTGKVHQDNVELRKKYDDLTKVPEAYTLPETIKVTVKEQALLDRAARKAGLNQDHYSKMVEEFHAEENTKMQALADRRKALGEEKVNVIHDYVKKFYPAKLQDVMFNEIIKDDDAMKQAMEALWALLLSMAAYQLWPRPSKPVYTPDGRSIAECEKCCKLLRHAG